MTPTPTIADLPDPLIFADGRPVTTPAEWRARRAELLEQVLAILYGPLPSAPARVTAIPLHDFRVAGDTTFFGIHYRLMMEPGGFSFLVTLYTPPGDGPFPAIIDGDGCWRYLTDEIICMVVNRGYALAFFNRVEIVADMYNNDRNTGLYTVLPDEPFRALGAWAWGYHRVVDFLETMPRIDDGRIIAVGHSRGGKTALLAGATDERIALTAPNNSGCGGAGCYRFPDEGAEELHHGIAAVPYWYAPILATYIGRAHDLPFDQHSVKALIAPRALLTTEARGDIHASPYGTRLTHEAAREVYRFLGAEEQIGIWYRDGGHRHGLDDWAALLDFADARLCGKTVARDFDMRP